jgi:hypothetical protein
MCEHLDLPLVFCVVRVAHLFNFLGSDFVLLTFVLYVSRNCPFFVGTWGFSNVYLEYTPLLMTPVMKS